MYENRDAAFQDWALNPETVFKKNENGFSKADLQSAFNAGWKARKLNDYELALEWRSKDAMWDYLSPEEEN